jgi:hypothetical protein
VAGPTALAPDTFSGALLEEQWPPITPVAGPVMAAVVPSAEKAGALLNPAAQKPRDFDWRDYPVSIESEQQPPKPETASLDQVFSSGEWLIEVV